MHSLCIIAGLLMGGCRSPQAHTVPYFRPGDLATLPFSRGNRIFTSRYNRNEDIDFCVQDGLKGKPHVILAASQAPLTSKYPITDFSVDPLGHYCIYFLTQSDPRFEELRVLDIKSHKVLADDVKWTHYSDICWTSGGFYYGGFKQPTAGAAPYQIEQLRFHRLGTDQSKDEVIYEDASHPSRRYQFLSTYDQRYFMLHRLDRNGKQLLNSEFIREEKGLKDPFIPIQPTPAVGRMYLCDNTGPEMILMSQYKAPQGKVISINVKHPAEDRWKVILDGPFENADVAQGILFVSKRISPEANRLEMFDLTGKKLGEVPSKANTAATVQPCEKASRWIFISVETKDSKDYYTYDPHSNSLTRFK